MFDKTEDAELLVSELVAVFREAIGEAAAVDRPHLAMLAARRFVEHAVYECARTQPAAILSELIRICEACEAASARMVREAGEGPDRSH